MREPNLAGVAVSAAMIHCFKLPRLQLWARCGRALIE